MKKEYAKPYLAAENFEPQEYCAPCTVTSVTQISNWNSLSDNIYVDLNGDGTYQTGERFSNLGKAVPASTETGPFTSKIVSAYKIKKKMGSQWEFTTDLFKPGESYSKESLKKGFEFYSSYFKLVNGYLFYADKPSS